MMYILGNGVEIESGERTMNRTGYFGVTLSLSARFGNMELPFSAECAYSNGNVNKDDLTINSSNVWKGGYYADAREAAYVVAMFKLDAVYMDKIVSVAGVFDDFPSDLYDLPLVMTLIEAQNIVEAKLEANQVSRKTPNKKTPKKIVNSPIAKYWKALYDKLNIPELAKQYGKDVIINARKTLTVGEFMQAFGVTIAM